MAIVYRARDLKHDRLVAIKVLKPELAQALGPDRFLREIKLTAQLNHPHILPLLDSGEADGLIYYVMPYIEGESLRHRLLREHTLPLDEALRITREVADGLESAHRRGVIHRDVKPENILLEEGHAVVADFGIARAVAESSDEKLTATGIAVGTPEYMSPEQMMGGRAGPIDARTDVYALAAVLYELLTGAPPKHGTLAERPEIPADVARVLRHAMDDDPERRFPTTSAFVEALPRPSSGDLGAVTRLVRRPKYAIPAILLVLLALLTVFITGRPGRSRERGRALLAQATRLADSGRYEAAYAALTNAERALPGDSAVNRLMPRVADIIGVTSEPSGATVSAWRFGEEVGRKLGETPLAPRRMPRGDYRILVEKTGFVPYTTISSTHGTRSRKNGWRTGETVTIAVRLAPAADVPAEMVFVPGGSYTLASPKMPLGVTARLDDYFIDAYEVSNAHYQAFVSGGGYPRAGGGLARFVDKSGMAGPRGWTGQEYPQDRGRHPVTGVSWTEASAYCAAQGKRLPTVFEWEKAARNGQIATGEGWSMPWGYSRPGDATDVRANFGGSGTMPVDAYPFGISTYGAYNMAGNVKEWTANPLLGGRGVTGGSWEDLAYLYSSYGAYDPSASSPALGFRCARSAKPSNYDQGAFRIPSLDRTPVYTPVSATAFPALRAHYRYDPRALEPQVLQTVETPDWTRLKISYIALDNDTALGYLYVPKQAAAPYQTIVYLASTAAFSGLRTVPEEVEWAIGPNIRAGRAVFAIVFRGSAERAFGPGWEPPAPSTVRFRDLMVLHGTEMRRAVDYLETRDDIDKRRLAYVGLSWGAGSRLPLAAIDDRFHAVVLIGGGIDERLQPTLPEASNINFAPYIRPPKLVLNGDADEEHPWQTRGLPLWNLLREPKQLVLLPGVGHIPALQDRVPAINRFLDQTLGPVHR